MSRYVYLVEARPVDDAGTEQVQRWSCGQTNGQPYGGYEWVNCLLSAGGETDGPFTYSAEIPLDTTVGGRSVIGYGALRLAMQYLDDQALTLLALLHWDARAVRIWRVLEGAAFDVDTTDPIFEGTTDEPQWGVTEATLPLFDQARTLDVPLQESVYLGTGGLEGHADLKGVRKPLAFGWVFQVEPIALDHEAPPASGPTYARVVQLNDGPVLNTSSLIPAQFAERGLEFDNVGFVADVYAWSPVAGWIALDAARGVARTGSTPVGVLTTSFVSGVPLSGSTPIASPANVLRAVLRHRDRVAAEDIDEDALATLILAGGFFGVYVQDDRFVSAVCDTIATSLGAAWRFTATGTFTIRAVGFRVSVATFTADDLLSDISPVALPPPVWRLSYQYQPRERPLTDTDIGDAAVEADIRMQLSRAFTISTHETSSVKSVRLLAREAEVVSRINDASDASVEGERQARLLRQHRRQYVVRVRLTFGTLREGDTVTLQTEGFGLDAGADFLVRRIEWHPSLLPDEDEAELTLWGPFVVGEDERLAA